MQITLQQAIFLLSNITTKKTKLLGKLASNYTIPLTVNGKSILENHKVIEVKKLVSEIKLLQQDMITLKTKLAQTNATVLVNDKTLGELLEEVRLKREFINTLETVLTSSSTVVEQGVGVVEYGAVNNEELQAEYTSLEKEVTLLSQKIDEVNANTIIEVELQNN